MLRQRVLTAVLLAPVVLIIILLAPTWLFALALALLFLGAAWEWSQLSNVRSNGGRVAWLIVLAVIFALLGWQRTTSWWPVLTGLGATWWLLVCLWLRHFAFAAAPTPENRRLKLAAGALTIVPCWIAAIGMHASGPRGHEWTFLALLIVWAADTGAYFSGRHFGRRKLAPNISPGKTWAGVYGALVAGALVALAGGWLLDTRGAALLGLALLALCTVAASIIGDLLESLLKRHAQVKDSGTLFPGHGGLLDRLDSVFAAMPVFALGKLLLGL